MANADGSRRDWLGRRHRRGKSRAAARRVPAVTPLEGRVLLSLTIDIDYSYDANNFFNTPARRAVLQQAAAADAAVINDSLAAITPAGSNTWSATFPDPATGTNRSVPGRQVPADTVVIYVGGGALPDNGAAGQGSTGGYSASGDRNWLNLLAARGKAGALTAPATAYGPWGGAITFDDSGSTAWYFGQSASGIASTQTDFLSVAEHEIGHVLGLGTAPSWQALVSGAAFHGSHAEALNNGRPVPTDAAGAHWADGTRSGGGPALMDPILTEGTRVQITPLDAAGLADIGWQTQANSTPPPSSTPAVVQFATAGYVVADGGRSVLIKVTRTGDPGPASVNFTTGGGSALAGTDYTAASSTLTFAQGQTAATFSVPILDNSNVASTHGKPFTVGLTLSNPGANTAIGSAATATLSITHPTHRAPDDFDGDGRTDPGVFRPSAALWIDQGTTAGKSTPTTYGAQNLNDVPVPGDYDGVGHAEYAVFRPSTAQWFVLGPNGGHLLATFGATNGVDIPVPGDYDGVGYNEPAVFRPSTAQWFVLGPDGGHLLTTFGAQNLNDIPAPADYDGTGHTEPAVFRPSTAQWFAYGPNGGHLLGTYGAQNLNDIPVPGDYDGEGHDQLAVFRPATGQWFARESAGGKNFINFGTPNLYDLPVEASIESLVDAGDLKGGGSSTSSISSRGGADAVAPAPITARPVPVGWLSIVTRPTPPAVTTASARSVGVTNRVAAMKPHAGPADVWLSALDELTVAPKSA